MENRKTITEEQTNKLQDIHNLVNNEVAYPKFIDYLENNVSKNYDEQEFWNPWINLHSYLHENKKDNCFNITTQTEIDFFMYCVFNDDFQSFIEECNQENSTEVDWNEWVNKYLTIIN